MVGGQFKELWWGLCQYVIVHTIVGGSPVILWISLGGKPKWLPLKFGYHDVMRTSPIMSSVSAKYMATTLTASLVIRLTEFHALGVATVDSECKGLPLWNGCKRITRKKEKNNYDLAEQKVNLKVSKK